MIVAVVPVKAMADAKRRLAPLLAQAERAGLAEAMLADVLGALGGARRVDRVVVVADAATAVPRGPGVLREPGNRGYDAAVATALGDPAIAGADAVLVLPADLPLVTAAEIDRLAAPLAALGVRLAPAHDGDGTNGLLMVPPGLMATAFGPGSFARHRAMAEAAGAAVEALDAPGLALDIDTPQDLRALCRARSDTETTAYLERSGIRERLSAEPPEATHMGSRAC